MNKKLITVLFVFLGACSLDYQKPVCSEYNSNTIPVIKFAFNSAKIEVSNKSVFDTLTATMEEYPNLILEIYGHTDSTGPETYNIQLGLRRAIEAKKLLISAGIKADRIVTLSKGESEPFTDNATKEGRRQNRRISMKFKP